MGYSQEYIAWRRFVGKIKRACTDGHDVPPKYLSGIIINKNLSNFQKEYNGIRLGSPNLNEDEITVEAVKNVSFWPERIKLGYSDVNVNATGKKKL